MGTLGNIDLYGKHTGETAFNQDVHVKSCLVVQNLGKYTSECFNLIYQVLLFSLTTVCTDNTDVIIIGMLVFVNEGSLNCFEQQRVIITSSS